MKVYQEYDTKIYQKLCKNCGDEILSLEEELSDVCLDCEWKLDYEPLIPVDN